MASVVQGVLTRYVVDTNAQLPVVLATLDASVPSRHRTFTGYSRVISQHLGRVVSYYLTDAQSSVRAITNVRGQVTDTFTYDAFGNLLARTGTTPASFLYRWATRSIRTLGSTTSAPAITTSALGRFLSADPGGGLPSDPATSTGTPTLGKTQSTTTTRRSYLPLVFAPGLFLAGTLFGEVGFGGVGLGGIILRRRPRPPLAAPPDSSIRLWLQRVSSPVSAASNGWDVLLAPTWISTSTSRSIRWTDLLQDPPSASRLRWNTSWTLAPTRVRCSCPRGSRSGSVLHRAPVLWQ